MLTIIQLSLKIKMPNNKIQMLSLIK